MKNFQRFPRFSDFDSVGWLPIIGVFLFLFITMAVVNCNNPVPATTYTNQYYQEPGYQEPDYDYDFYHVYGGTHYPRYQNYTRTERIYVVPSTVANPYYRVPQRTTSGTTYPIQTRVYSPSTPSTTSTISSSNVPSRATRPGPDARTGFGSTRLKPAATLGTSRTSSYKDRKASTSKSTPARSYGSPRSSTRSSVTKPNPRSSSSRPSTTRSSSSRKRN